MPAESDLPQQLILDRYRPLEDLGEGGYGSVVLAWDTKMQRRVAIKRLPLYQARERHRGRAGRQTPSARESGLAEARTAALLNHPDIVTVHEWDTDSDEAFLIMEHVDGASVADLLDDSGALDLDEAAAALDAVFSAVEFAHENGVLHLDLKPQNVLVARDGRVKVADFGISALSTATGHAVSYGGTPGYMPPEQIRGEPVDARTDVWALGSLAFELLTNANPFVSDSAEGALFKVEVTEPSVPSDFDASLSPAIDNVIMTALAVEPADRYPSVTHFAASLMPLLGDERMGKTGLRDRVDVLVEQPPDDAEGPPWERVGLWDRTRPFAALLARAAAAATAGWLAWFALTAIQLSQVAVIAGTALAALAGILAPVLGVAVGIVLFSAGLVATNAYWTAATLLLLAAAYWWFVARGDTAAAILPLASPILGVARVSLATPFLAGFAMPPVHAALASLAGGALCVLAWAASPSALAFANVDWHLLANPLAASTRVVSAVSDRLVTAWNTPFTYIALATWALAAVVMSLACRRASRPAAVLGTAMAALVLWGGYLLAGTVAAWVGTSAALLSWETVREPYPRQMTASLILVVLVIAAGPPVRPEEE